MNANFFQAISDLNVQSDWTIIISKEPDNKFKVSVLLNNNNVKDEAKRIVPPMNLRGTAQELDEGFFDTITKPAQQTDALFTNMGAYMKQLEQAEQKSKMEREKKGKDKKKEEKPSCYEGIMQKVEELEAAGKYNEALLQLPKAEQFPDNEEEIEEKRQELWEQKDKQENNLFS
jgi:PRTRC genetic system protein E